MDHAEFKRAYPFQILGTTWAQEIVYLINNDLNFEEAKKQVLETRFPYLEYPLPGLSTIEKTSSPRLIKTHLPFELLPSSADKAKVVYVTRNPKDTVVSYFHFTRMFTMFNFVGTFDDFLEKFQQDQRNNYHKTIVLLMALTWELNKLT